MWCLLLTLYHEHTDRRTDTQTEGRTEGRTHRRRNTSVKIMIRYFKPETIIGYQMNTTILSHFSLYDSVAIDVEREAFINRYTIQYLAPSKERVVSPGDLKKKIAGPDCS